MIVEVTEIFEEIVALCSTKFVMKYLVKYQTEGLHSWLSAVKQIQSISTSSRSIVLNELDKMCKTRNKLVFKQPTKILRHMGHSRSQTFDTKFTFWIELILWVNVKPNIVRVFQFRRTDVGLFSSFFCIVSQNML